MHDKFFTDLFDEGEADIVVIGVPNGTGGKEYVDSVREQSWFVEIFDIDKKRDLFDKKICDVGDMSDLGELEKRLEDVFSKKKVPIIITKGDIASYHACKVLKRAKVVSFDAHTDLWDEYTDDKIESIDGYKDPKVNSATWLKRTQDIVGKENISVIGLRSIDKKSFEDMEKEGIFHLTPREIRDGMEEAKEQVSMFTDGGKIWVNLDVDCFDPSIAPNVDYPEPGGISFQEFQKLVSAFRGKVAGITLCGGNPMQGNVTEFLSVRAVFELLTKI